MLKDHFELVFSLSSHVLFLKALDLASLDHLISRYDEKLFAKCSNSIWAPLLEKAFAKLMGCYEKMDSHINNKGYTSGGLSV